MRIRIRIDENNPRHTRFTVFVDGGNCGTLTMLSVEAFVFFNILQYGADPADVKMEYINAEGKLFSDSDFAKGCIYSTDEKVHRGSNPDNEGV